MKDQHPSPSASTGKEILKSVFQQPQDPVDHRIECAQCGFNKNLDQATEGPSGETDSTNQESGVSQESGSVTGLYTSVDSLPQALKSCQASYIGTFAILEPVVTSGCPFCGSYNSRALGRDSDPFITNVKDLRNAW